MTKDKGGGPAGTGVDAAASAKDTKARAGGADAGNASAIKVSVSSSKPATPAAASKTANDSGPKSSKKVFDVVRPGKAPASPTSRPVITGHNAPVSDDQFVPSAPLLHGGKSGAGDEKPALMNSKEKKQLTPVSVVDDEAEPNLATLAVEQTVEADLDQQTEDTAAASIASAPTPAPITAPDQPAAPTPDSSALSAEPSAPPSASSQTFSNSQNSPLPNSPQNQTSISPEGSEPFGQAPVAGSSTSIDQLLAETGAPDLEPDITPTPVVSHHSHKGGILLPVLVFIGIILIAAVTLNFLLDAQIIQTTLPIPHTEWL